MNTPAGPEQVVFAGTHFEVVRQAFDASGKIIEFETARRSPGVRLIIVKKDRILLTREHRVEHDAWDYRLPGGKVFDSLKEYRAARESGADIAQSALQAARKECMEECGLVVKRIDPLGISKAGAMVQWDLHYFVISEFEERADGQDLKEGEEIDLRWCTFGEAKEICLSGKMREDRSVGWLLRYLEAAKIRRS